MLNHPALLFSGHIWRIKWLKSHLRATSSRHKTNGLTRSASFISTSTRRARDDEQYLVFYAEMLRFREQLDTFPDIKAQYLSNPEVQSLLALCEELPQ